MIPLIIAGESVLVDEIFLVDDSPSSAVQSAHFDPAIGAVRITFHEGGEYSFPCSASQWLEYRNADSKGGALASVLGVHGGRK